MAIENGICRVALSPVENMIAGAIGGALEITIQMPILTYKLCVQEGRALPTTVEGWYRGVVAQAGTVAPMTALQLVVQGLLLSMMMGGDDKIRQPTTRETLLSAAGAGFVSATVYSPVDLITIQQQKLKHAHPMQTLQFILEKCHNHRKSGLYGLYRGYAACAIRGSIYTTGYLGLAPIITSRLRTESASPFYATHLATAAGACISGILSAVVSHPFDTAKTCLQSEIIGQRYRNTLQTILLRFRIGGLTSLYKGLAPRLIRNCGAFFVVNSVREMAIHLKMNSDEEFSHTLSIERNISHGCSNNESNTSIWETKADNIKGILTRHGST
jgi:hypothetical protein